MNSAKLRLRSILGIAVGSSLGVAPASAQDIVADIPDDVRLAFLDVLSESGVAAGFGEGEKAITNPSAFPPTEWLPWRGPDVLPRIEKIVVVEKDENGIAQKVERYWEELSEEQFRRALKDQYGETLLFKKEKGGGLNFTGTFSAGANFNKGDYQLFFNQFKYKSFPCSKSDPTKGEIAVGVGLRYVVDAHFNKGGFNIGIGPLALSASKADMSGVIRVQVKGLSGSVTLSNLASELASAGVTYENLIKASNLNAVVGQVLETIEPQTPSILAYRDGAIPGSCMAALQAEFGS